MIGDVFIIPLSSPSAMLRLNTASDALVTDICGKYSTALVTDAVCVSYLSLPIIFIQWYGSRKQKRRNKICSKPDTSGFPTSSEDVNRTEMMRSMTKLKCESGINILTSTCWLINQLVLYIYCISTFPVRSSLKT